MKPDAALDPRSLETLIAAAAQGDPACFSQVYERTNTHLFGVAVRILGQGQAAEDVLQEAYVSIWKSAGRYRSGGGRANHSSDDVADCHRSQQGAGRLPRARRKESALPESGDVDQDDMHAGTGLAPSAMQLLEQASQAKPGCPKQHRGVQRQLRQVVVTKSNHKFFGTHASPWCD
ncbi:MAG: sigma factor [Polaromonas sp.]|uniref:sigma factor n=1 Tax=Polaromonas sp. TaxID=1869339 RepID=UPI002734661F|nr:sigma factor [Polaromonas sp.]MDP2816676.1 sigma factor [Polaromonas sp.]